MFKSIAKIVLSLTLLAVIFGQVNGDHFVQSIARTSLLLFLSATLLLFFLFYLPAFAQRMTLDRLLNMLRLILPLTVLILATPLPVYSSALFLDIRLWFMKLNLSAGKPSSLRCSLQNDSSTPQTAGAIHIFQSDKRRNSGCRWEMYR